MALLTACVVICGTPGPASALDAPSTRQEQATPAKEACSVNVLADTAGLFGSDFTDERDPINAFTLYGTVTKKYSIEMLDGEKVVSRKRGFTVNTCTGVVEESQESPQFQGLPVGDKMLAGDNTVCRKSESTDLKDACVTSCSQSCSISLDRWATEITQRSGYKLTEKDKERLLKSCNRNCTYECGKPGKSASFIVPYRR